MEGGVLQPLFIFLKISFISGGIIRVHRDLPHRVTIMLWLAEMFIPLLQGFQMEIVIL